jgi:hypothetical protein
MNAKLIALISIPVLSFFVASPTKANPAPNLTIFNPSGTGAEGGTTYIQTDFQSRTRNTQKSDGAVGIGIGIGNARDLAIDANYSVNSLSGGGGGKTGDGGFSVKAHRQLNDDTSIAAGYNQFATTGTTDYQKGSYYAVGTKVIETKKTLSEPFSRVAVTVGVGGGVFNGFNPNDNPNKSKSGVGVFGSISTRVSERVAIIAEYTGQDLAAGASIVPFKDVPLVVTPAMRDIGSKDGARFTVGLGYSFKF